MRTNDINSLSKATKIGFRFWQAARVTAIAALVGSMLSPPLLNFFIFLCFFLFLMALAFARTGLADFKLVVRNPVAWGAVVLWLWMVLAMIWSVAGWDAAWEAVWKYRKLLWVPLMMLLFYNAAAWRLRALKWWAWVALALMFAALVQTLPAPIGYGYARTEPSRPFSSYSYISLSMMLLPLLSVAVVLLLSPKSDNGFKQMALDKAHLPAKFMFVTHLGKVWQWLRMKPRWLGFCLFIMVLLYTLWAQEGRTAYVVLLALAGFIALGYLHAKTRWLALVALVSGLMIIWAVSPKIRYQVEHVFVEKQVQANGKQKATSSGLRLAFWRAAMQGIEKHPVLGNGMGSWSLVYKDYADNHPQAPPFEGGNAHQEFLMIALQAGLVGALLFLAWLASIYRASKLLMQANSKPDLSVYSQNAYGFEGLALQSLLLVFVVSCLFNSSLYDSATGHFFCIAVGILASASMGKKNITMEA